MIVFLNGAFGIGKTTVAHLLRARLPRSAVFDPERIGWLLQRLPAWVPLEGRGTDDFQDLALWRRATVVGIRAARARRRTVIVPMAFSNRAYLDEVQGGVAAFDADVRRFCLVAPLAVVLHRQSVRGRGRMHAWQVRRATECCAAHADPAFGEPIDASVASADALADAIADRLR